MNRNFPVCFTGYQLKYIALLSMTIDHIGAILLAPGTVPYFIARGLGRIAFPVFCFLLVEGFFHTSNYPAYFKRLLLFAFLSELPFDMAFYRFPFVTDPKILFGHQNIFFTLSLGFLALYLIERFRFQSYFLPFLITACAAGAGWWLHFDYGGYGVLTILFFYFCQSYYPGNPKMLSYLCSLLVLFFAEGDTRLFLLLCLPLFLLYNGRQGTPSVRNHPLPGGKYFFYIYYPAHLLLLFTFACLLGHYNI